MKLYHPCFEGPIEFKENQQNQLVVESPEIYTELIIELKGQLMGEQGRFVLSEGDVPLNFSKTVDLCIDYFNFDLNQRKTITALYHLLAEQAMNGEWYLRTQECMTRIFQYLAELTQETSFPLSISEQWRIEDLFKIMGVSISSNPDSLLEQIVDYLKIFQQIGKIQLFIFVNLKSWISEKDFMLLYDYIEYQKIKVLFIENIQRMDACSFREKYRIIDCDGCVI